MKIPESTPIPVVRALGAGRSVYWQLFHPLTFGAAVAITDVDISMVALIMPTYGKQVWQLPGGGIDRANKKAAKERLKAGVHPGYLNNQLFEPSARREVKEEVGFDSENYTLDPLSKNLSVENGNRDTLHIFHARVNPEIIEFTLQKSEVKYLSWYPLDSMPTNGVSYLGKLATDLSLRAELLAINF